MYKRLSTALFACLLGLLACTSSSKENNEKTEAGKAMEFWSMVRTYPDGQLHPDKYALAFEQAKAMSGDRGPLTDWEGIGPKNIGGRTLCMAIHPLDSNILFLGSACGGIWKSTTAGKGEAAWERIETGFPVLGVAAIAIDPTQPNTMYIGTGELYGYEDAMPNIAFRTTRGTYGIGILKTTNGGQTWQKSLDWAYNDLHGVQDIKINPLRPQTVYATTTVGLMRSYDAGNTWTNILERPMAVDLEIFPNDTSKIMVSFGSLDDDATSGIFRSVDGGNNFEQVTDGLPASYSGKSEISIAPSNPNIVYVSAANAFEQIGLFKSTNGGASFFAVNTNNTCTYQGWYSHDIAIKPDNPQRLIWGGIDTWVSSDGGTNFMHATNWYDWFFGQVPVGGPEGPGSYVHADIHHLYFHPGDPTKVYAVTDGGLFVSHNAGGTWEGCNGGYQTQQFYANFSNSSQNADIALGGLQDNATAVYTGSPAWTRGIGGDGCCTAINPFDDQIMFGTSQYGNIAISSDGGNSWAGFSGPPQGYEAAFVAPFEFAPSNPDIMYMGANGLLKYDFNVGDWAPITPPQDLIITLGISNSDPDDVFFSTAPGINPPGIYHVNVATQEVTKVTGLPNRIFTDIARKPADDGTIYAVCGGFGTSHIWRSVNNGQTWTAIDNGIPDVPANSILIDPLWPPDLYVGNDLGVWYSGDSGQSWTLLSAGAPQAMLAMHLSISADRKLRVATHGLGVWQTPLVYAPTGTNAPVAQQPLFRIYPNPVGEQMSIRWEGKSTAPSKISIADIQGRTVFSSQSVVLQPNTPYSIPVGNLSSGTYAVIVEVGGKKMSRKMIKR